MARIKAKRGAWGKLWTTLKNHTEIRAEAWKRRFMKKILPPLMTLIHPHLAGAMSGLNMSYHPEVQTCEKALMEEESTHCIPIAEINSASLLKYSMTLQLNSSLQYGYQEMFKDVKAGIWNHIDPHFYSLRNGIMAGVSKIPYVGTLLSIAVGHIFDRLYKTVKKGVELAMDLVGSLLKDKVLKGILDMVMETTAKANVENLDAAAKTALASALKKAKEVADSENSAVQKQITDDAAIAKKEAEKEAEGVESTFTSEGQKVQGEVQGDETVAEDLQAEEEDADFAED